MCQLVLFSSAHPEVHFGQLGTIVSLLSLSVPHFF